MDDQQLIQLCMGDDRKAQRLLYEQFVAPMARLCLRYLRNEADVQEVLTEGFVKVFRELRRFEYRGAGSLQGWIRKIMVNEALMYLRKGHGLSFVGLEAAETDGAGGAESPLAIDPAVSAQEIVDLVRQLPDGYRVVFNLFAIEGYSHKEIAAMLGIAESASRSQLAHARARLKEHLKQRGWT
ncbi:MAG: sigma-70 family RNA polymerase sigma factor [Cytophagales bacterium]|nr:sigma-70 family RNA polymerase sigma factor [Cytophagales bacterium]